MSTLALLTAGPPDVAVSGALPALELLTHQVVVLGQDPAAVLREDCTAVLVDSTQNLVQARSTVRTLHAMGLDLPVVAVFTEGGLAALDEQWPVDDIILTTAGPAEVQARLRLVLARRRFGQPGAETAVSTAPVRVADVVVDEGAWTVRAGGEPLDLTYKEFELLKYLVHHPGRVVTREQLLQEVWGMDYYGGTRTVDVHIRRLRAKLGPEREALIGTIRNVGYRFAGPRDSPSTNVVE